MTFIAFDGVVHDANAFAIFIASAFDLGDLSPSKYRILGKLLIAKRLAMRGSSVSARDGSEWPEMLDPCYGKASPITIAHSECSRGRSRIDIGIRIINPFAAGHKAHHMMRVWKRFPSCH
ncbi:MAG: hypothetical protein JNN10_04240 [Sphingopyxis sp.]|uniref:hypothetical protein n=1 Tax=Sphingopyxis sp. TaxID=1908224 RepID=UPI001A62A0E0|nr:hypothetical protein [Sphingopyxis sp.]MBL9065483.1 hypothetical protein [Sphingopyxis sp.]